MGSFRKDVVRAVVGNAKVKRTRPEPAKLEDVKAEVAEKTKCEATDNDLISHLMYPTVLDKSISKEVKTRPKAAASDALQIGAPIPGMINVLNASVGKAVSKGDAWIFYLKDAAHRIKCELAKREPAEIYTCSIVRAELLHGAMKYGFTPPMDSQDGLQFR